MENTPVTEKRTQREAREKKIFSEVFDYFEIVCISLVAVLLIFTFALRLCRVDGDSMNNTLTHGENLVISDVLYTPKRGDVVVFHLCNDYYSEPLVKRVIATEGETVRIDYNANTVSVNGKILDEDYIYLKGSKHYLRSDSISEYTDFENGIFEATVPEGHVFVLGDNRNNSSDSRSQTVGMVDTNVLLGRAIFRVSPFTFFD